MITKTFLTRTLSDIVPGQEAFEAVIASNLNFPMTDEEKEYLFILIFSRYADSHVRYTNEDLFVLNLRKEIMVLYPTVLAFLRDQKNLRDAQDAELMRGGRMIANMAAHNTGKDIPNDTTDGLELVDTQTISTSERARIDVLAQKMDLYKAETENRFLNKLNKLFVQIIQPQRDLLYATEPQEDNG